MKSKTYLLVPAYNEAENIPALMQRIQLLVDLHPMQLEFVVVNDGSSDSTLEVVKAAHTTYEKKIIDVQPNQGLANAMRTGIEYIWSVINPLDTLVTMDADDSHNPLMIPRMIHMIHEGNDIVIASRFRHGSVTRGLSRFRRITGAGAGMLFRTLIGLRGVRDYTCGYRAFSGELMLLARSKYGSELIKEQGFSCTAEILLKLSKLGAIIHELPMILRYDRKKGASKMNVSKTVRQTLSLVFKYRNYGK